MRLEMTKKSDLALKAMRCIGDAEGETIAGKSLAEKLGITTHYLPQVISPLVKAGWVSSTPGPRGGYRLLASLEKVSVLEVIDVIEGSINDQGCVQRGIPVCREGSRVPSSIFAPYTSRGRKPRMRCSSSSRLHRSRPTSGRAPGRADG